MLTAIKRRTDREDDGFTLIELMVVVLIIAILLAIAIPTFLGARDAANARAAQANLRNALTAEQTQWTNNQAFSTNVTTMTSIEQGINWITTTPVTTGTTPNQVAVYTNSTNDVIILEAAGKDGNCWYVEQSDYANQSFTGYGANAGACAASPSVPADTALTNPTGGSAANNKTTASATLPTFYTSF